MPLIIETNVLATANGAADHAGHNCVLASIRALREARGHILLFDHLGRIFAEYLAYASRRGQPGPGDAFMKWVWDRQANKNYCRAIEITPLDLDGEDYLEFPRDAELATFDRADRKWVAVALAKRADPEIFNATDTDWWHHHAALQRNGVRVRFLCPELMRDVK